MTRVQALLLTDVVDSTKLAERLGDAAMADLWARHDRVARDLLAAHGGLEIDKTDGFLFLFDGAAEAVAYAIAYHGALAPLGISARAGLHVGPVILRENTAADVRRGAKPLEVEGLAKPTAARVMGLAAGRQTLLTAEARAALGDTALRVASHGHWRMKGLSEPVELFEVGADDAPFTPPPDGAKVYRVVRQDGAWLPVKVVPHSLPRERDVFVGRQADLQELARRLDDGAPLVSVVGTAGTGKTRLVVRYGWTWLGDWPGGVWFCDLSEARDADGIAAAVGRALDVALSGDTAAQLARAIASRGRCLVILDNFEQVARDAPGTLGLWLDRAREAAFVVTTREILGLPGEQVLALPALGQEEAVALFEARAASAKRGFVVTAADRADVVALVDLLDRLPLCIELAAARVRVMTPKALVARMGERFQLLAAGGGRRDRQATLRAALDWSWDLLSPGEQLALAQLSVFEGGFTLEAAEGVLDLRSSPDAPWALDAVQSLVDKSLVRAVGDDRFDLLVSVQAYGGERLAQHGGVEAAERSHAAWFARYGDREAVSALHGPGGLERHRAFASEVHNLVAACRRATAAGEIDVAVANLQGAREVLQLRGPGGTTIALADALLASPAVRGDPRAWVGYAAAVAALTIGRNSAAYSEAAYAAGAESADPYLRYALCAHRATAAMRGHRWDEVEAAARGALAAATEYGRDAHIAGALSHVATALGGQARLAEAKATLERALALATRSGHAVFEMNIRSQLAANRRAAGAREESREHVGEARRLAIALGARSHQSAIAYDLGTEAFGAGDLASAAGWYQEALSAAEHTGRLGAAAWCTGNLAYVEMAAGRHAEAARLARKAGAMAAELGDLGQTAEWHGTLAEALRLLGQPAAARAEASALAAGELEEEDRTWCLTVLALLDLEADDREEAGRRADALVTMPDTDEFNATRKFLALARIRVARGELAEARRMAGRAAEAAHALQARAYAHAAEALVAGAEGDRAAVEAAIGRASVLPALCAPETELARLFAQARAAVAGA